MAHRCPVKKCTVKNVADEMLMCLQHWRMVPPPLQNNVWRAWGRGAGFGTEALGHAQDAAIKAVNDKLAARAGTTPE